MRKLYSLVLMAAALLIGTNAWARTITVGNTGSGAEKTSLSEAFAEAVDGDEIKLLTNITISTAADLPIWIGEADMAEESGTGRKLTLDLNGKKLTRQINRRLFDITHGSLTIKTSSPEGEILDGEYTHYTDAYAYEDLIILAGSRLKDNNPKTQSNYYSYLMVEEGVTINSNQNVVVVDASSIVKASSHVTYRSINYNTNVYSDGGVAHGVRVDIKGKLFGEKYAIKTNGNLQQPWKNDNTLKTSAIPGYTVEAGDLDYSPYVYIYPSGELHTAENSEKAAAAYASGYARWHIEGYCGGNTGLYAKSGEIELVDATIVSNNTNHTVPTGKSAGINAGGSAIVLESSVSYAGMTSVTISGDTKVEAAGGYAIEEKITTATSSKVEDIVIEGGTLEGGSAGAIYIEDQTKEKDKVSVIGGNVSGDVATTSGTTTINEFVDQTQVHTTVVVVDNKPVVVISDGAAPAEEAKKATWNDVAGLSNKANPVATAWTAVGTGSIEAGDTVYLGELQMISGTADDAKQVLTIKKGACLDVQHLMMNNFAQITVEAGASLIIEGEQGIVAPAMNNIILKNEGALLAENRKHATFLFNPAVTSNRHPNATVELTTYSFRNGASDYQWERFGVPTHNALKNITTESSVPTAFAGFINGEWQSLGYLNYGTAVDPADFNKPFATYELMANRTIDHDNPAIGPKYNFIGELVGNDNANLNVDYYWTPFTNSYAAEVDVYAMLAALQTSAIVKPDVYIARPSGLGSYSWDVLDADEVGDEKLSPMQAFILKKAETALTDAVVLNYNDMVWAPATAPKQAAPRRRVSADDYSARVRVIVESEQGVLDNLKLRETATRTKEAEKYMNVDVNIYAMAEMKDAILAAENLENTYVGFSTVKGGTFTLSFADVEGREFTLVDHETGARVAMVEGSVYEFTAAANSTNDYRFEIVDAAKMPTAIENTEAVKSAKGIYTITGQYMGEMSVWNTLPAGVYVVNGEKLVK